MPKMLMFCVKHKKKHSVDATLGKLGTRNVLKAKCPISGNNMFQFAKG